MSETVTQTTVKTPPRKSKRVAIFGAIVLFFAIIGVIATIVAATGLTVSLVDNTAQKNRFKQAIFPLVLLDPPAFDSIEKLDSGTILNAAMWDFIIFADKDKYQLDDLNNMTVPAVDIEAHIVKLFGTDAAIEHQEISQAELQIPYDMENKAYSVPYSASMASYVPEVQKISRSGDLFTLTVGYIPSGSVWGSDITGIKYEPDPDKILEYVLKQTGKDSYIITAVQEIKQEFESSEALSSEMVESAVTSDASDAASGTSSLVSSVNTTSK